MDFNNSPLQKLDLSYYGIKNQVYVKRDDLIHPVISGNKWRKLKYNLKDSEIAYVGDDLIDIPVMEKVAVPIATQNAVDLCKKASVHTTSKSGGDGAFREAVEWILTEQGRLEQVILELKS